MIARHDQLMVEHEAQGARIEVLMLNVKVFEKALS